MRRSVLTTFQAAEYCGVSPYTVRNWVEAGSLAAYATPGGHRRIRREDLDAFLQAHGMPVPKEFAGGARRILIADAPGEGLASLRRFVDGLSERVEVRAVSGGFDAAWALLTFRPQLFLLALDCRGLDGLGIVKRVKGSPETSATRVVVMTGRPTVEVVQAALEAGALDCLVKPLDRTALAALLAEVFPSAVPRPRKRPRRTPPV